ncbi:hypothetical protein Tco_0309175 [Tanacetum coccineum]
MSFCFKKYNFSVTWSMQREYVDPAKIEAIKKWEKIMMDLVTKLPSMPIWHDTFWEARKVKLSMHLAFQGEGCDNRQVQFQNAWLLAYLHQLLIVLISPGGLDLVNPVIRLTLLNLVLAAY